MLDVYSRECVVATAAPTFRGHDVAEVLSQVAGSRGLPVRIRVDNGTEFTSKALDHGAYWHRVELDFSRPRKPVDNTSIEANCSPSSWWSFLGAGRFVTDCPLYRGEGGGPRRFTCDEIPSTEAITNLRQNPPDASRWRCMGSFASIATAIRSDNSRSSE